MVGQAHLLSPECSAMGQQNCYPHFQNWGAGVLNFFFRFVQETCSHQLKQYWADTLTTYLLLCKQATSFVFVLCGVHSGLLFCSQGKNWAVLKSGEPWLRWFILCVMAVTSSVFTTLMQSDWFSLQCHTVPCGNGEEVIKILVLPFE